VHRGFGDGNSGGSPLFSMDLDDTRGYMEARNRPEKATNTAELSSPACHNQVRLAIRVEMSHSVPQDPPKGLPK
ncbi:MAG: hypothetical protein ACE5GH_07195, partial [Fidelibacterota bacterium]